ncbi:GHMP kinase [Methanogenium sp. MK-MG]|uniref:GHMP family kinase ATP-binding protein n=1 Tax=Methanogenium sp. MK-MG TaxID=2599926 RepID=UPI0013EC7BCB|nr:GHMP kinase [Methanogenium sp. MK-MG]KAF1073773.1 Beta-ribofuranosylaminobenzene 5'-phosphate synthase [Methanogenium sp. MK-MG]
MAKMIIRGGDLDLVEYDFAPFSPGESINTLGYEQNYSLDISDKPITVRVPARIHLTVLDMNRFAPNRPGGGGFGFALQLYSTATVECIPSGVEINYTRVPMILHLVAVLQTVTGYTGGFRISVVDHERKHVGLGSTGTVLTAVAHAINTALGSPLTTEQLRLLVGYNYVEETATGEVVQGFETGVGPAAITYGGMAVLGDELTLVCRHSFAKNKNVFIIIPSVEADAAGESEFNVLMNRARTLDYRDRELKAYMVLMDLIPALIHDDLRRVGDVVWEIEFRGSKRAEVEHNSFMIYQYMSQLREAGFEFVAMSSVGPTIAVVTGSAREEVEAVLKPLGIGIALETKVDNEGIKVI